MTGPLSVPIGTIGYKDMMEKAGLARVEYFNMTAGVVALHRGYKI